MKAFAYLLLSPVVILGVLGALVALLALCVCMWVADA
jgi:hypothetical protein